MQGQLRSRFAMTAETDLHAMSSLFWSSSVELLAGIIEQD